MPKSNLLKDFRLVVTRPEPQASKTVKALVGAGAEAVAFPQLTIVGIPAKEVADRHRPLLSGLTEPTKVIYVSAAAVQYGVPALKKIRPFFPLARHLAIGATTATALAKFGLQSAYLPKRGEDSEALLAESMFEMIKGQTIVVVKGVSEMGGRTFLAETLVNRGAMVVGLICYRRAPTVLKLVERAALKAALANATHVLAGSIETLEALLFNSNRETLPTIRHLLVPHVRVAAFAKRRGVKRISVVSLEDNKLIESLNNLRD